MNVVLGLRAARGGAVAVAVALEPKGPRLALSTHLATAAEGDRLAYEPYHVAAEMAAEAGRRITPQVEAAVAEGRRRQADLAAQNLEAITGRLAAAGLPLTAAALLVNRAGWVTDLLSYSLLDPNHPPVAEGLAVRDALRAAAERCGLALTETDEKSLPEMGPACLGLTASEVDAALAGFGAAAGRPWRKEQKLAALAAWVAAAATGSG